DVAISVYGKPFQTAVTLLSLIRHSKDHINKIYFIKEAKQPRDEDFRFLLDLLGERVIVHIPKYWLWVKPLDPSKIGNVGYRHSIRYQFAWEHSVANYLYVTHNDVLYTGDLVGSLLAQIGSYVGIGQIGQCWNCPAFAEKLCRGDKYLEYRPT